MATTFDVSASFHLHDAQMSPFEHYQLTIETALLAQEADFMLWIAPHETDYHSLFLTT